MVKKRLCAYVPEDLVKGVDELIRRGVFTNKSDAVSIIIYTYLKKELQDSVDERAGTGKRRRIVV